MPKKRSAYGLKDFNAERILQQKYFHRFNIPTGINDDDFLQEIIIGSTTAEIKKLEENLLVLRGIYERLQEFANLISRHMKRVSRYFGAKGYAADYLCVYCVITDFGEKIKKEYYSLWKITEQRYRERTAAQIRKYRKLSKLTQKELGEKIQQTGMSISQYETAQREVPTPALIRLSKVFGITTDELLGVT